MVNNHEKIHSIQALCINFIIIKKYIKKKTASKQRRVIKKIEFRLV